MKTNSRKRLSMVLAIVCCLTMLVGSLAYFTDRAELSATATAGNLSITAEGDITGALKLGGDDKIANSETLDNWNPGDSAPFSYTVTNTGNKAVRVQEELVLTVTGVTEASADDCMLTITGAGDPVFAAIDNGYTLTYTVENIVLSGDGERAETVEGKGISAAPEYTLAFNADALNEYQDAGIAIAVTVDAIQYANTEAGAFASVEIEE